MTDSDVQTYLPRPTATRPLLGMTVLVVEDSRFASDAMRLLCLRSGARIRRADCLFSARRHLNVYRPTVAIIDLGLPDGCGAELISEMVSAAPRVGVILGTSGDSFAEDVALAAGADGFLAKPVESVLRFQSEIISHLPPDRRPAGVRMASEEPVCPDPMAYRDDMALAADVLDKDGDAQSLDYVAQFLRGVAVSAGDIALQRAAEDLAEARSEGRAATGDIARVTGLVQERLEDRVAI